MTVVGGLRARLVRDSLYRTVEDGLRLLGWFDPARGHAPVNMRSTPVDDDEELPPNTLVLVDEDTAAPVEAELGSNLAEHAWAFVLDFYAEDPTLGLHLIRDVRDLLDGRMPSIGRGRASFEVRDWTQSPAPVLFRCEIEDVEVDRGRAGPARWQRHWFGCAFDVVDRYGDDG